MIARVLYGLAFCVALPGLLAVWSSRLDAMVHLPRVHSPLIGAGILSAGAALMLASFAVLWLHGKGLPMNAFPPRRFVRRGPYRWSDDPIYIGFVACCLGASVLAGSPAGFWIATPFAALASAALVLGYERRDLERRFGEDRPRPLLRLPPPQTSRPPWNERLAVVVLVLLPWLALYELAGHLPVPGAFSTYLSFERSWPVLEWTEIVYASAYPVVALVPFLVERRHDLRRLAVTGLAGTFAGISIFLIVPAIATPREFEPSGALGWLLELERSDGVGGRAAFPAFHVFWAMTASAALARTSATWRVVGPVWVGAVAASCITTGMHAIADLIAGALLYLLADRAGELWKALRRAAEAIANSWREWTVGPVRIINHGLYAGLAAFVGVSLATALAGPGSIAPIAGIGLAALVGAGLWGQALVGSRTLLRPFGYFGSVLGGLFGVGALAASGVEIWPVAAALAVAAPWVQAVGRCRCLIQGCCHGAPCPEELGIRYRHERSRVLRIARLGGVPLHPTPLYSIAANAFIGLLLARLWWIAAPPAFIAGAYLVLAGLARFVEEGQRGEPQTQVVGGLRIYQWCAVASVLLGIGISMLPSPSLTVRWAPSAAGLVAALAAGALYAFAMGVDFPASDWRFSRLA